MRAKLGLGLCTVLFLTLFLLARHSTQSAQSHSDLLSRLRAALSTFRPSPATAPPYAFATFLGRFTAYNDIYEAHTTRWNHTSEEKDGYFVGARYLNYALRHDPATRSSLPFIVLATADVEAYKKDRLQAEGAIVIDAPKLDLPERVKVADPRYVDVLSKLNLWRLTSFKRICFLDADTLVTQRLDGVFGDPATELQAPNREVAEPAVYRDGRLVDRPWEYSLAAHEESGGYNHTIPPAQELGYFNAGFGVLAPSLQVYEYYLAALRDEKGAFVGDFPEQDLLNNLHKLEGAMPWQKLDWRWNVDWPTRRDLEAGARSLHAKYWEEDPDHDQVLRGMWREKRWEMEGFWRGRGL